MYVSISLLPCPRARILTHFSTAAYYFASEDPLAVQGHRLTSYLMPSLDGPSLNESQVIVDRCDAEHNTTQRWQLLPATGGAFSVNSCSARTKLYVYTDYQ